jgi:UDP-N-acetylglucosamine 2-epimerase
VGHHQAQWATPDAVYTAIRELLDDPAAHARMATATGGGTALNPYDDGHAAQRIVDFLLHLPPPGTTATP